MVLWARVSSREQREQGWSLPEQVRELREYAEQQGWAVAREYAIDESATRKGRITFNEMLDVVESDLSIAAIVSLRMDRLLRGRARDRLRLEVLRQDTGLKIRFVKEQFDETAFGEFVLGLRQGLAGLETGLLMERIQEGLLGRAKEGWYPHAPPFPYVRGNRKAGELPIRLDPARPERAALAKRLFEIVAEGHKVDEARELLAQEGHVYGPSSRRFPRPRAYALLRDRFCMGEFEFQGDIYPGKHEPIVSRELWERAQDVLDGRSRGPYGRGAVPYNGLIKCGLCGASMTGETIRKRRKDGSTKVYGYLRCSMSGNGHGKRGCKAPRLTVEEVERHLGELVELIRFEDDALEVVRSALRDSHRDHVERVESALASHRRQVTQAEERRKRAHRLALDGALSANDLRDLKQEIDGDLRAAQTEVARLETTSRAFYDEGLRLIELAQRLYEVWLAQDSAKKREILDCLLLNCVWDGVSLAPEWRRPFDLLAERPSLSLSRGDRI